jgi:hypothetical protein
MPGFSPAGSWGMGGGGRGDRTRAGFAQNPAGGTRFRLPGITFALSRIAFSAGARAYLRQTHGLVRPEPPAAARVAVLAGARQPAAWRSPVCFVVARYKRCCNPSLFAWSTFARATRGA